MAVPPRKAKAVKVDLTLKIRGITQTQAHDLIDLIESMGLRVGTTFHGSNMP